MTHIGFDYHNKSPPPRTCSETVEDHSPSEGVDDDELIADGVEMIEEEYEDVEAGDE